MQRMNKINPSRMRLRRLNL